jgi:hypothetical protein
MATKLKKPRITNQAAFSDLQKIIAEQLARNKALVAALKNRRKNMRGELRA